MSSNEHFLFPGKRVAGERNLVYAALHPFPLPGWEPAELVRIRSSNWQVIFKPDGANYIEIERGGKIVDRHLEGPNVLIAGIDGLSDPAEAIREQKPLVDAIRGLFLLAGPPAKPILLPSVWEGVLKKSSPETVTYEVVRREATWLDVKKFQLEDWGIRWHNFNPLSSPPEIGFALRWFYKGMMESHDVSGERVDTFIAFWLCIITLVRAWHSQHVGGDPSEMMRFIAYAEHRWGLTGAELEDIKKKFEQIRNRRNELFKGGGGMVVSQEEENTAAGLAQQVLDYEIQQYSQS